MTRARKPIAVFAAAASAGLALAGVAWAGGDERPATATKGKVKTTMLYDVAPGFFPGKLTVKSGTKLVWKSDKANNTEHTVTLDMDAAPRKAKFFDSGDVFPGKSYSQKLKVKGSYLLYCKIHAGMFQTVKVR